MCLERSAGLERPLLDEAYLQRLDELHRQRYLRDIPSVVTPKALNSHRVPADAPGLVAAPSRLTLVRGWSDLTQVKPTAIADAVMCTDPTNFEQWIAPCRDEAIAERVAAILQSEWKA